MSLDVRTSPADRYDVSTYQSRPGFPMIQNVRSIHDPEIAGRIILRSLEFGSEGVGQAWETRPQRNF
jgi:hypothetical protein